MGKTAHYLRHFFMLDAEETYEIKDYSDYNGPGFNCYKASPYFKRPGIKARPGYLKAEVAAYSEITKIALLIGMAIIVSIGVWGDIKFIQLMSDKELRHLQVLLLVGPIGIMFNILSIGMYPRAIFLFKNFKAPTQ